MSTLRKSIETAISKGTRIVSFDYDNKTRNVLVGSNEAISGTPVWGKQINRAVRIHNGKEYLIAKCNNENGQHPIKAFELSKIQNLIGV